MEALRRALHTGVNRRALRDGGGVWAGLAVLWYGARFLARLAERQDDLVHHQVLKPGESVTITHTTITRRGAAKAAKATAKQAKRSARKTHG